MASGFPRHFLRSQSAEFFVNNRQQFPGGFGIAILHSFQNMRELAQVFSISPLRSATTPNEPIVMASKQLSAIQNQKNVTTLLHFYCTNLQVVDYQWSVLRESNPSFDVSRFIPLQTSVLRGESLHC
jgi:hypothetical protein